MKQLCYSQISYYNQLSSLYLDTSPEKLPYKPVYKATRYFAIEKKKCLLQNCICHLVLRVKGKGKAIPVTGHGGQ
jgi:hypothetical protein